MGKFLLGSSHGPAKRPTFAYRTPPPRPPPEKAKQFHPDANPDDPEAKDKFQEVQEKDVEQLYDPDEARFNSELRGLDQHLRKKLDAVQNDREPGVADIAPPPADASPPGPST